MPKRYLLFAGYDYYPDPALHSLIAQSDDLDELKSISAKTTSYADTLNFEWAYILDTSKDRILERSGSTIHDLGWIERNRDFYLRL